MSKLVVMVNGERHGEPSEDIEAVLNAAVDVVGPPSELRLLFMFKFADGKYSDDGKGCRVWIEEVE